MAGDGAWSACRLQCGASSRRAWPHPLEWAHWRATDAVLSTASAASDRLAANGPLNVDELVGLWRLMLGWTDEIAAAAAERGAGDVRHGTGASVQVSGDSWQQAEQLAAAALRQMGHSDAHVTGSGTDRGLDVSGRSIAAQVKYTGAAVGRPLVQQLIGASGGRATAFFSRSGYSTHAVEEADQHGMALFTLALPSSVTAVNGAARRLSSN